MIEFSTPAIPANPEGQDVKLTRAQIWQGLLWKGEYPTLFVKPILEARIVETYADGFLREILHQDDVGTEWLQERIFLEPMHRMTFLRMNGRVHGQILNLIEGEDDDPTLRFAFTLGIEGEEHGGEAERQYEAAFEKGYVIAVNATLEAVRESVRTGVNPTLELARERHGAASR
jgi:acetylaranotin biosynthesis cluster protein L